MTDKGSRLTRVLLLLLAAGALIAALTWALKGREPSGPDSTSGSSQDGVVGFLTAESSGEFAAVAPGVALEFPRDHGPHPEFRQEWWYFTGNLSTSEGRRFGFQLTFFRFAHGAFDAYRPSAWRSEQSWMAHFAVSDVDGGRFVAAQDYARGVLGLAGASAEPFEVWVNGWSAKGPPGGSSPGFRASLSAASPVFEIRIDAATDEPPVLQGEAGYSIKDREGRTASYYYSLPDLAASGTVRIEREEFEVHGRVWMDREWSTAVLAKGQAGWDWFALRPGDGAILMLFQVREQAGEGFRYAMYRSPGGEVSRFHGRDITMRPLRSWVSPRTGSEYPLKWQVLIPKIGVDIVVDAALDDQELDLDFSYWEGVVDVSGSIDNRSVGGAGYLELTGY